MTYANSAGGSGRPSSEGSTGAGGAFGGSTVAAGAGGEFRRIAAGGAVADGDDRHLVLADQRFELVLPLRRPLLGWVRVDHGVLDRVSRFVQHGEFAAGAEPGVDGKHPLAPQRRLQ